MPFQRLMKPAVLCALISSSGLTACATMTATGAIENAKAACLIFRPVSWAKADTGPTIAEIKEHNAVWKGLCR